MRTLNRLGSALLCASLAATALHAQGQIVRDSLHSRALEGNLLEDSPVREIVTYLPPSYRTAPNRRYPVLYLLHGFTSTPDEWLDGSYDGLDLRLAMDSLIAARAIDEFIVVMPNVDTRLGGGFYTDSPTTGGWATFVVHDLLTFIDGRYRTIPERGARALAGHSMGGYGTLVLGFAHPELFGMLYAMSPGCVTFVGEIAATSPAWAAAAAATTWPMAGAPRGTTFVVALAAALSPAPGPGRWYGRLPFEPDSAGQLRPVPAVRARWEARMPLGLVSSLEAATGPPPAILIEYGLQDQVPSVVPGSRAVEAALDAAGIPNTVIAYTGGHIDRQRQRISEHLLPAVGRWFGSGGTATPR
jgi:enterochelin esterase-like enzyme